MQQPQQVILATVLLVLATAIVAPPAGAQQRDTLLPRYFDLNPHDGLLDPGSTANPWEARHEDGSRTIIRSRYFDLNPHDGLLDPGSPSNPYIIERVE
jgi:hypothetical protein